MPYQVLRLDADPVAALAAIRESSRSRPVLVFKRSPICPTSTRAEGQLEEWLDTLGEADDVLVAGIDVIAERALARGLTRELGIAHQSPQALWFANGELVWHDSHGAITVRALDGLLA